MAYASAFHSARPITGMGSACTQFGSAVWAIGTKVETRNITFATQGASGVTRGAACVRASFFGNYSACSFHMKASDVPTATSQLSELIASASFMDPIRVLAGDANMTPTDRPSSTAPYSMSLMTSFGYNEADQACAGYASCSQKATFSIRSSNETKKLDYIFAIGYSLVPRSLIWAKPDQSDHSEYVAWK
jgi:endonuclease/exonuclease/phosphatase family metal-dependent hydrolase